MQTLLINGAWIEAGSGATRRIDNPATREPVGVVSEGGSTTLDAPLPRPKPLSLTGTGCPPRIRAGFWRRSALASARTARHYRR